jgi:hypothetical protein
MIELREPKNKFLLPVAEAVERSRSPLITARNGEFGYSEVPAAAAGRCHITHTHNF